MKRELKVKELQLMDAARRRFLKQQQDQRLTELHRLDEQIQRKVCFHFSHLPVFNIERRDSFFQPSFYFVCNVMGCLYVLYCMVCLLGSDEHQRPGDGSSSTGHTSQTDGAGSTETPV